MTKTRKVREEHASPQILPHEQGQQGQWRRRTWLTKNKAGEGGKKSQSSPGGGRHMLINPESYTVNPQSALGKQPNPQSIHSLLPKVFPKVSRAIILDSCAFVPPPAPSEAAAIPPYYRSSTGALHPSLTTHQTSLPPRLKKNMPSSNPPRNTNSRRFIDKKQSVTYSLFYER